LRRSVERAQNPAGYISRRKPDRGLPGLIRPDLVRLSGIKAIEHFVF
jgi:hypothetical protein